MCHIDMNSLKDFKIKGSKISVKERDFLSSNGYKWCGKCKQAKPFDSFAKNNQTKDGYNGHCKECKKLYRKLNASTLRKKDRDRYWSDPEKFRELRKEYVSKNYSKVKESKKQYYKNNRDRILSKNNQYRINNLDKIRKKQSEYHLNNKESRNTKDYIYRRLNRDHINEYNRNRYNTNLAFRLKSICRQLIRRMYLSIGTKKEGNTRDLLGYSPLDLKQHIENQFKPGMNWDNYGEWHIDHITPISRATTLKEGLSLSKLKNLQPLWAKDNLIKSNN